MGSESISLKPVINLGNSIVGVSILAVPYCYSQCGVVLGSLLVFFNALLTIWSCKMLIRAANMTRSHTYETLALAVFGKMGKLFIEISIIALNIGTCIAYFVIIGDLAPPIIAKLSGIHVTPSTLRASILVFSALFIAFPLGLLRNINSLSAISIMSLLFYFFLTVQVIYLSKGNILSGAWHSHFVWWSSSGFLKCLPILSLAFACHTQMFVIYSSLHDPGVRKMSAITERAVWMIFLIYSVVGLFGYITYCNADIKGDILANFSLDSISQLTRLGFATSVVLSFPLMIFPCRASINSLFCSQAPNELHVQEPIPQNRFIYITAGIVGTTVVIAILIPNVETVLALTGATTGSLICFIFPGLLFLKVAGSGADFSNRARLVLVIGLVSMVLSTAVVVHTEMTRSPEVELPISDDINKPDIVKLPPVDAHAPADKISDEGVKHIEDKGGGLEVEGDKEARKEPALPEQPKNEEEDNKVGEKPVEPVKPVKPVNPAANVIDIPPNGGEDKHKPAEPVLPDNQPQQGKQEVLGPPKDQGHLLEKKEEVGKEEVLEKVAEVKEVREKNGGGGQDDTHERIEKDIEKLSNRLDELEVENRELREKQDVIEKIHSLEDDEGREGEKKANPPAEEQVAQKEEERKNPESLREDLPKAPAVGDDKANLDKQEQAILEALEKDDVEKEKREQKVVTPAKERGHEVERREAVPGVEGKDGVADQHAEHEEKKVKEGGERKDGGGENELEIGDVHLVQEEELGDNAGNIAPAKGPGVEAKDNKVPPPEGEKELFKKRDILNYDSMKHGVRTR